MINLITVSVVSVFKALGDESRVRIVNVLSRGTFNVQELTMILGVSQSTVSHHLRTLQGAGIVEARKEGTWTYYTLKGSGRRPTLAQEVVKRCVAELDAGGSEELTAPVKQDLMRLNEILVQRRDQARQFFDRVAPTWSELREGAPDEGRFLSHLISHIPAHVDLLELGCGVGTLLQQITPREGQTIGVDFSQAMLDEARRNLDRSVQLRLGQLEHLPLADESVDMAVAYMVFHHIADPREALHDIVRVLRPRGRLALIDLCKHKDESMRERYADLWLGFDLDTFSHWVESAGLAAPRIELLGSKQQVFYLTTTRR